MNKIKIQDFLSECHKISNDATYTVETYIKSRYPHRYSNYLSFDDVMLISEKLIAESQASDLDIKSFRNGVNQLLSGEHRKASYDSGIKYVTSQYIQRF